MGQKVHPYGFRLGINKPWKSRWFVERGYDKLLVEDVKLKAELREKLKAAGVSSVEVERPGNKLRLIIRTARPGIIIGRKGTEIDKLKADIQKRTSREVFIDILENQVLGREFKRGELTVLRRQIEKRFGPIPGWAEERLTSRSPAELEELSVRILDASSMEDLLP